METRIDETSVDDSGGGRTTDVEIMDDVSVSTVDLLSSMLTLCPY